MSASSANALPILGNGSFETPVNVGSPNNVNNGTPGLFWAGNEGIVEIFSGNFGGVTAYEGNQWAEVQSFNSGTVIDDTISQNVTGFTIGNEYEFTFAHRGRAGTDTMKFDVMNGMTSVFTDTYSTDASAWVLYTGRFTATATSLDLIFTAISSGTGQIGNGNFLDAVNIQQVPGPLPFVGAATAFAFSRRLRKRIKGISS